MISVRPLRERLRSLPDLFIDTRRLAAKTDTTRTEPSAWLVAVSDVMLSRVEAAWEQRELILPGRHGSKHADHAVQLLLVAIVGDDRGTESASQDFVQSSFGLLHLGRLPRYSRGVGVRPAAAAELAAACESPPECWVSLARA